MERIAILLCLLSVACGDGWTTYENTRFGYKVTVPDDFQIEESLVQPVTAGNAPERQTVNFTGCDWEFPPVLEVGVNSYSMPTDSKTLVVIYDYKLNADGTLDFVERDVVVPSSGFSRAIAFSLFIDTAENNVHSFSMELADNDHEPLFVDMLESFRLVR